MQVSICVHIGVCKYYKLYINVYMWDIIYGHTCNLYVYSSEWVHVSLQYLLCIYIFK